MTPASAFIFPVGFSDISPLSWSGILVSLICAGVIGVERQVSGKAAGIRTSILICLGAYAFVSVTSASGDEHPDYGRIIGQLVTGVGFLGAGVMMTQGGNIVGVTSASVIWILAAIGAFVGMERHWPAIVLAILTVIVLSGIGFLEKKFKSLRTGVHKITTEGGEKGSEETG